MNYVIFVLVFIFVFGSFLIPPDDTDKGWFNRSGLSLYTDNKTGIQYIKGGTFGDMIPRLDENGKQMRETK